jgi:hypothetical protein
MIDVCEAIRQRHTSRAYQLQAEFVKLSEIVENNFKNPELPHTLNIYANEKVKDRFNFCNVASKLLTDLEKYVDELFAVSKFTESDEKKIKLINPSAIFLE